MRQPERKAKPSVAKKPAIPGLTTYEDLIGRYRTMIAKTPSGLTFIIQSVNPGDYIVAAGSPLLKYWDDLGIDVSDQEQREKAVAEMPKTDIMTLAGDQYFQDMVRNIVCAGIVPQDTLRIVNKPQMECDPERCEISVDILGMEDMSYLFIEIMKLSRGEEFEQTLGLFREADELKAGEAVGDQDTPDQQSVQSAAQPDIVPANSES